MTIHRLIRPGFALLLGLALAGCGEEAEEPGRTTPEAIRGVWTTEEAEYADRRLEIMEEAVLFHTEEHAFDPYVIQELRILPEDEGILYEIDHAGWEGGSMTLSLFVHHGDSTLVFKNRPFRVWKKVAEGG